MESGTTSWLCTHKRRNRWHYYCLTCLPTMCRALFIWNEQASAIHPIPLLILIISPYQLSFPEYTQLNTYYHTLPIYCTCYDIKIGSHIATYMRFASYSASMLHPHAIRSSHPSSSLLPQAAWRSRRTSLYQCTRREIATWLITDKTWQSCSLQTPFLAKYPPACSFDDGRR